MPARYSSPPAGNTVCLAQARVHLSLIAPQNVIQRSAPAASGREKSIFDDSLAPGASRLFVS